MSYKQDYTKYLREHIDNVQEAFEWLKKHKIYFKVDFGNMSLLEKNIANHDLSKWSDEEFEPYAKYFYQGKQNEKEFDKAWNHHQKTNPHHWQYWVLMKDNPTKEFECIPMGDEYIVEMICDWWSFSFKEHKLENIFDWYDENKKNIKFHPDTKKKVEKLLDAIKEELEK